jgi:squalene-associated FAD-dependent desaturase
MPTEIEDIGTERPQVLVIGGGFAGAAAAARLAEGGLAVTLLEERPTLGGRATSFKDGVTKQDVDNGQHLFLGAYRDTQAFLKRLGVLDRLRFEKNLAVPFINRAGRRSRLAPRLLPGRLGLLAGVLLFRELRLKDKLSLVWGVLRARPPKAGAASTQTVSQWLAALHQTPGARRAFWDPLCYAALNERPDRAAAAAFVAALKEGFLAGGNANGLGHSVLPLGRLWTVELAEYLKRRGGRVAARLKATRLHLEGDRVTAVDVEGEPAVRVDAVVLATPLRESWDLFPESLKSRHPLLEGAEASPILAVNFWFSRSPFDGPFVALLDMDLQWVFNREALWGPAGRGQVSAVLSAARSHEQRPSDELIALALADLRRAFPGFTEAPRHATVLWERRATPSPTPAFWSARPPVSTPVSNLVLAGDWTDVGLPPTIEAACRSGHRAAEELLRTVKHAPEAVRA